jgi:hypothetical protein
MTSGHDKHRHLQFFEQGPEVRDEAQLPSDEKVDVVANNLDVQVQVGRPLAVQQLRRRSAGSLLRTPCFLNSRMLSQTSG